MIMTRFGGIGISNALNAKRHGYRHTPIEYSYGAYVVLNAATKRYLNFPGTR